MTLIPVILSGGSGTRLWPVSRENHPKPFIKLKDGKSLLQKTFLRAANLSNVSEILTVTNQNHLFTTLQEYQTLTEPCPAINYSFILEPFGRNTAPAVAIAALQAAEHHSVDSLLLILAADHLIEEQELFNQAVQQATFVAAEDKLVTFGINPAYPHTGYGYIERGAGPDRFGCFNVKGFTEKPFVTLAQTFIDSGRYLWNLGMFCFKTKTILAEFERYAPHLLQQAKICLQTSKIQQLPVKTMTLDTDIFAAMPNISLDYAILEKASNIHVVPSQFGWQDIGCWAAASELTAPDSNGNRVLGEAILIDAKNNYIQSDSRLVAALGVDDLMVVDTPDALLISHRSHTQAVKQVVADLKLKQHNTYKSSPTTQRPWGTYTVLEEGPGFKIKRIVVKPGAALSLQMHQHRSEHWVVVSGTAKVTNGEKEFLVQVNESTYIPAGHRHRLENPGSQELILIEVQSGSYLEEDDIVRFEDKYART